LNKVNSALAKSFEQEQSIKGCDSATKISDMAVLINYHRGLPPDSVHEKKEEENKKKKNSRKSRQDKAAHDDSDDSEGEEEKGEDAGKSMLVSSLINNIKTPAVSTRRRRRSRSIGSLSSSLSSLSSSSYIMKEDEPTSDPAAAAIAHADVGIFVRASAWVKQNRTLVLPAHSRLFEKMVRVELYVFRVYVCCSFVSDLNFEL